MEEDDIKAEYTLPNVDIYPNNRWGDIARREGLDTARKYSAVKNAVYKGQRDFIEDPRTQAVMMALPLPTGLEGVGNLGKINMFKKSPKFFKFSTNSTKSIKNKQLYDGDWYELWKTRLNNGGYEKMSIPEGAAYYKPDAFPYRTVEELKNKPKILEDIRDRIKYGVTFNDPYKGINSDSFYHTIDKNVYILRNSDPKNIKKTHEYRHFLDNVAGTSSDIKLGEDPPGFKSPKELKTEFTHNGGTEILARGEQLKNALGKTSAYDNITEQELEFLKKNYTKNFEDNNMTEFFNSIKDNKKFLDWLNPKIVSLSGVASLNNWEDYNE
jgi:hypothetical protein